MAGGAGEGRQREVLLESGLNHQPARNAPSSLTGHAMQLRPQPKWPQSARNAGRPQCSSAMPLLCPQLSLVLVLVHWCSQLSGQTGLNQPSLANAPWTRPCIWCSGALVHMVLKPIRNFDAQRSFIEESSLYSCRICICICDTFSSLLES